MIFRRASYPHESFTTIPNSLLRGTNKASEARSDGLSPEALGVLAYLLSHKEDWQVTNRQLQKVFGVGDSKITRITRELVTAGYIARPNQRAATANWDWDVFDSVSLDRDFPDPSIPDPSIPDPSISDPSFPDQINTISKNNNRKEKQSWKKELFAASPEYIRQAVWQEWWEHKILKNSGRRPTASMLTRQTKDFELIAGAGFDVGAVVSFAISRDWQKIGDVTWEVLGQFKNDTRHDDLMGAVK